MGWQVVEAGPKERLEVQRIEAELFGAEAPARGSWLLDANPAGKGVCLVALSPGGRPVGARSLLPWRLLVDGTPVTAGQSTRSWTHPEFRRQGVSLATGNVMRDRSVEMGHSLLFAFPSDRAVPGVRRLGNTIETLLIRRQAPVSMRLLSPRLPGGFDPLLQRARRLVHRASPSRWSLLQDVRREADRLWERAQPKHGVHGVRDGAFVAWRYGERSGRTYQVWGYPAGGAVRFMAATLLEGNRGRIVDLWGDLESREAETAVVGLVEELAREGAWLVEWCPPRFGRGPSISTRSGFLPRRTGIWFFRNLQRPPDELGALADLREYRLTEGDTDYA